MSFLRATFSVIIFAVGLPLVATAAVPTKASVFLSDAKAQPFSDILTYPGRVKSRVNAAATSEIEGQVVRIEKLLGTHINKGDVVMVLQNTDPVYRYAPIKMRSPASGYLTTLDVGLMTKVERGQKLFTITDPNNLVVEVEIPSNDLSALQVGLKGEFKPDPRLADVIPVVIEGLSPLVDYRTGTASAELRPLDKVQTLHQGELGQINMKTNFREAVVLPESAIIFRDDKTFVRVLEKGKVARKPVELGPRKGDNFEIKKGLSAEDQVVVRASRFVADGEEVEVQKSETK
jgi:multidrug efflux pump subunit AcrA (membrane-fusion protein)